MATHIVRNPPRQWGNVVASNLSNVLTQLADAKVQQMASKHNSRILEDLGIDPVSARFIDTLPAKDRGSAVGQYLNQMKQQQEQQGSYADQVSANQQQFKPQQQQQQFEPAQQQQTSLANIFSQPNSVVSPQVLESVLRSPQRQQQQRQIAAQEEQAIQEQAQERRAEQAPVKGALVAEQPAIARRAPKSILGAALTGKQTQAEEAAARREERALRQLEFDKEKLEKTQESKANAATQQFYEEVISADKSAKESDDDLKKMKHLIQKGKLPPAQMYKYLKDAEESLSESGGIVKTVGAGAALGFAAGGPVGAALGAVGGLAVSPIATMLRYGQKNNYPDTEEFEKLTNGFIRYAKGIFGSRITDADLKAFLATVPTLANTDQGKKAIIHNMELFNKGVHEKYKVMREIIKENGGKRPLDLALQVQDKLDERLSSLANQWEKSAESQEASLLRSI